MRRVEVFSDGVFAIATLLVLDIRVADGPLQTVLPAAWPSYLAYAG